MIFIQGWGSIAGLVLAVATGALLESMGASRPVAYFCAGGALTVFGCLVNASADEVYKQRWAIVPFTDLAVPLGGLHRLFWIPCSTGVWRSRWGRWPDSNYVNAREPTENQCTTSRMI